MSIEKIDGVDSEIIKTCRVVCIFFMMSVHFYPYDGNNSILNTGSFSVIGEVWINYLGRASVATLSVISGYLLCHSINIKNSATIILQRTQALLVPMVAWNAVFIFAAMSLMILGEKSNAVPSFNSVIDVFNSLAGLFTPTANNSLSFIRDLFVCSVLLTVLWQFMRKMLAVTLIFAIIVAVGDLMEPVVFRPTILLFMIIGCLMWEWKIKLSHASAPLFAIPMIAIVAFAWFVFDFYISGIEDDIITSADNILKRVCLIFATLLFSYFCVRTGFSKFITKYEPISYVAYLSHVITAKFLWVCFALLGADVGKTSYIVYFIFAPFFVFGMAKTIMAALRRFPGPLYKVFTGKKVTAGYR